MHAMLVLWALSMLLCTLVIPDAYGTSIACILATLLILALTHHTSWQGLTLTPTMTPTLSQRATPWLHRVNKGVTNAPIVSTEV